MKHHPSVNPSKRPAGSRRLYARMAADRTVNTQARGRTLGAAALALCANLAHAAPTGGQVVAGSGNISQSGTTTTITQASQNLSVNWQGFNTTSQETVNFVQPSASAIAVNRISDTNGTQFLGHLNANGQVYLINPNGILFGQGAQVNVGGLVASTLNLDDTSLNSATRTFSGSGTGSVVNQGTINGRYVALLGNTVSNQGTITANLGAVALGAGSAVTLTFADTNLVHMQVDQNTLDNLAENGGLIQADGGTVLLSAGAKNALLASVVNNTGVIEARSVQNVNGTIVLDGGNLGAVRNSGTLDASGKNAGETGGTVKVLGGTVSLNTGSNIDVSGDAGGGTALIGGNFHGAGPEQNAQTADVATGASINADAINSGNGGNVAVWSDGHTTFDGTISARGGATGGDGGQVETSGAKLTIGNDARVTTLAPKGQVGNWLLDPPDFIIGDASTQPGDILDTTLSSNLNGGSVTIMSSNGSTGSNGDIIVDGLVTWTANTTLTLSAYRNITFSANGVALDGSSSTSASIVLHADNSGTGVGTVNLVGNNAANYVAAGNSGNIDIFYNPSSYASPTDYGGQIITAFTSIHGNLHTYMQAFVNNSSATAQNKTYDGGTTASLNTAFTLSTTTAAGTPTGATLNAGTASFNSKDVATANTVNFSGYTATGTVAIGATGRSANYFLAAQPANQTAHITAKALTASITATNKTYDGTTTATPTFAITGGLVGTETVTASGTATFSDKNVGTGKAVTANTVTLADGTNGGLASNYSLTTGQTTTANITAKALTASITATNKTYDGTTTATPTFTITGGLVGTETVTASGTATFADKNVGTGKTVTANTVTLADGTNGGLASNYSLATGQTTTANISAKALTASITATNKTYDGTTTATPTFTITGGLVGTETVTASGTATFADKNVGTGKAVTANTVMLADGANGGLASNYSLTSGQTTTANISARPVTLTAPNVSKTYDGGTSYTTTAGNLTSLSGSLVGGDTVTAATIAYADKNAGSGNKTVNLNAVTISDGNSGNNYSVTLAGNTTSTITQKSVTLTAPSVSKTYDGGTTYTTTAGNLTSLSGSLVGGDTVTAATIAYTDKNAGSGNKTVNLNAATISDGNGGNNYSVTLAGNTTSTINPASLTLSGITANNKVYDGSTAASLNTGGVTFTGLISGDSVTLGGAGTGTFADKNAGNGKTVTVSGYTLGGADASNYTVGQPVGLTANITQAALTASLTATNKTYDGTTTATPTFTITGGLVGTETVTASGTATFSDKNAGTGKTVTANTVTLADGTNGGLASNYSLTTGQTTTANISARPVTLTAPNVSKTYDGGTSYTTTAGNLTALSGSLVGGDTVTAATIAYADKNAGSGNKTVSLNAATVSDGNGGNNYSVTLAGNATSTITPAPLTITANNASKTFDGLPFSGGNGVTFTNFVGGETSAVLGGTLAYGGTSQGAIDVGSFTITPSGLTSGNYALSFADGLLAINAAPAVQTTLAPPPPVQNAVTQLQTTVLLSAPNAQPQETSLSPALTVKQGTGNENRGTNDDTQPEIGRGALVNVTTRNIGSTGPTLFILDGGIKLPEDRTRTN